MTGPDHYRKAEECLAKAQTFASDPIAAAFVARAQVHATLALAAATALLGPVSASGYDDADLLKWHEVAGTKGSEDQ